MQMLANLGLETRVRAALRGDPRTRTALITIAADRSRVTLTGMLERGLSPAAVAEVAAGVVGVRDVVNELRIIAPMRALNGDG